MWYMALCDSAFDSLPKVLSRNIHYNTALFHKFIDQFPLIVMRAFVTFNKDFVGLFQFFLFFPA